jgi:ectoine hydroxylase-related dioxygenase (phytanoyl-CoA dioxygenase family)
LTTSPPDHPPNLLLQAKQLFDTQGFLLLENVFDVDYIDNLREVYLERFYTPLTKNKSDQHYYNVGDGRYQIAVDMHAPFNDAHIFANPVLLPLIRAILGDNCTLDGFGSVISLPNAQDQHVHRDHPILFKEDPHLSSQLPCYAITLAIPLVDIDLNCGTTAHWPGSHKIILKEDTLFQPSELIYPVTKRGSAYLWDYRLVHFGTANKTQKPRPLMYLAYSRKWFSDVGNHAYEAPVRIT